MKFAVNVDNYFLPVLFINKIKVANNDEMFFLRLNKLTETYFPKLFHHLSSLRSSSF